MKREKEREREREIFFLSWNSGGKKKYLSMDALARVSDARIAADRQESTCFGGERRGIRGKSSAEI